LGITEVLGALLSVIDKVMDRIPTVEQSRKKKYHNLKEEYYEELQKPPGSRDANKLTDIYYQLVRFATDFAKDL